MGAEVALPAAMAKEEVPQTAFFEEALADAADIKEWLQMLAFKLPKLKK